MAKTVLQRLQVKLMQVLIQPTHAIVSDAEGNIGKASVLGFGYGNADGGSANAAYVASQNIDGGSANAVTSGIINGGNA